MEINTAICAMPDPKNGWAILDTDSLERDVENFWGLNQQIEVEVRNPMTRFYRGALRFFGKETQDENRVYTLLAGMQEKMNGLLGQFENLQVTYQKRGDSMVKFLTDLHGKQEQGNGLMKKLDVGIKTREDEIEKSRVELEKMDKDKEGFYKLNGRFLMTFIEKKDLEGLEAALEKNMDLMDQVTRRAVVDLLSAGRVHGVLTGFKEGMSIVVGYFENAIGIKMYEIQAGRLTEQAKKQLTDFGRIVGKFYVEARKGLQHIKQIESGNLLEISYGRNRGAQIQSTSFETTVMKYLSEGKSERSF